MCVYVCDANFNALLVHPSIQWKRVSEREDNSHVFAIRQTRLHFYFHFSQYMWALLVHECVSVSVCLSAGLSAYMYACVCVCVSVLA